MTTATEALDGTSSQISTFVYGIGHLISDRLLAIPDYQRSYSWGIDEVQELWEDIAKAMRLGAKEYFLGSIVTTTTSSRRQQVIDGQQRLATITLLYAAMRDIFGSRSDERAAEVERDFLGKKNMKTRELEPKLTLNADDNDVFQHLVRGDVAAATAASDSDSHSRLVAARSFLHEKLMGLIADKGADDWQQALVDWHDYVLFNAKVIEVHVSNENRAFIIFETLNDRGLNLSTADLLKGHLFGTAGDRIEEAKTAWAQATTPFAGQKDSTTIDTFLRHYWASTRGVARVKALFSEIRGAVTEAQTAIDLAKDLARSAPLWQNMFDRDAQYWATFPDSAKSGLETLKQLNVEQCRPLLLAAMRRLPQADVASLVSLLVSWSVRWFVVGGGSAGVTERLYAESARDVSNGTIKSAEEIAARFLERVPNDRDFQTVFSTHTVRRGWLARYYLVALERTAQGEDEPELVPNLDRDQVNLEHVLARNAVRADWPAFSDDEFSDMKLMLGNQVLLPKTQNANLGNGSFSTKKATLAASSFELTREVGEADDWTPEAIKRHQLRLAELAVATWRRS
jgi:hypothetical protein